MVFRGVILDFEWLQGAACRGQCRCVELEVVERLAEPYRQVDPTLVGGVYRDGIQTQRGEIWVEDAGVGAPILNNGAIPIPAVGKGSEMAFAVCLEGGKRS